MIVQPQLPVATSETGAEGTTQEEAAAGEFAALLAILGATPEEQATSLTTAQLGLTGQPTEGEAVEGEGDEAVSVIVDSLVASMLGAVGDGSVNATETTGKDGGTDAGTPLGQLMAASEGAVRPTSGGTRTSPTMVSAGPLERGDVDEGGLALSADATVEMSEEALTAATDGAETIDQTLTDASVGGDSTDASSATDVTAATDAEAVTPGSAPTDTAADGEGDGATEAEAEVAVPLPVEQDDEPTTEETGPVAAETTVAEADALGAGTTRPTGPTGRTDGGSTIPLESGGPAERGAAAVPTTGATTAVGATAPVTPTMPTTVVEAPQPLSQVPTTTMANVQQALRAGESQHRTVIRLDPPELGTITLEVTAIGDEITVIARADNAEAGRALARQRNDMATAVEALGMSLSEFDVQTGSGSQSPDRERNAQRQQREETGTAENPFEQPETPDNDGDIFL